MDQRKFTFYHADRDRKLSEGMELTLPPSRRSSFGEIYAPNFSVAAQSNDPALLREWRAEGVRISNFPGELSRMECMFAANSALEAEHFAKTITPTPEHDIPIFEIFASTFTSHDMNWLDYSANNDDQYFEYMQRYWWREISNSTPSTGERKAPCIEVKIALPATVGKVVSYVKFSTEQP